MTRPEPAQPADNLQEIHRLVATQVHPGTSGGYQKEPLARMVGREYAESLRSSLLSGLESTAVKREQMCAAPC